MNTFILEIPHRRGWLRMIIHLDFSEKNRMMSND